MCSGSGCPLMIWKSVPTPAHDDRCGPLSSASLSVAYETDSQSVSELFTALMSCAMSTVPSAFSNAGHALAGWVPRAIFTPMISSLIDTAPLPSQSPVHDTVVALAVALADGAGVPVGVALEAGVLLGNEVAVPLTVGVAVAVRSTLGVALADRVEVTVAVALEDAVRVLVGDEERVPVADGLRVGVAVAKPVAGAVRVTVAVAVRATVGVGLAYRVEVTVGVALEDAVRVLVGDEERVPVADGLRVGVAVAEPVAVAVRVTVEVALRVGVAVEELVGVSLDVGVRVGVRVAVDVGIATVALGVGVWVNRENGAENSEVLLLMSVLVAVTCGPLSGPLKVQLPSVVKTEPSKTRPWLSASEKISTVQWAHEVPCSGPMPSMIGNPRSSLPPLRRAIPFWPLA
jgi:hypothetical protein